VTLLGPHLAVFLREHLPRDRRASPHTCEAYATSFQLLVVFAARRLQTKPSALAVEQIDAELVLAFLEHLEVERGNGARSRNARLAAINTFFRFLQYRLPDCLDQAGRIHAIPMKKTDEALVTHLTRAETKALLDAPDPRTSAGTRDRAMLHLAFAAGLRVSELVGLRLDQVDQRNWASIHVMGKGRRERVLPLWKETAAALKAWIAIRPRTDEPEFFLNSAGRAMTRSGFEHILAKHVRCAGKAQLSLIDKRVTPHVLRHTCAMHTLQATHDVRKVSLWLGHATLQSTEIYLRADPTGKLEALAAMEPPLLRPGRFKAPDKVLSMLADVRRTRKYAE
jgi:site-specific recombinase XerD